MRYDVYRSTTSGFTPGSVNLIGQPTDTGYSDTGLSAGTYYYRVAAEDGAGHTGPASNEAPATVTVNNTSPTVSITAPAAGAVNGVVTVTATASAGQGVAGVQFKVDGQNLGAEDPSSPFSAGWERAAS